MKALVKAKPELGVWMEDVKEPSIGPNDVLIKIHKTAICGTDLHIYKWDQWAQSRIKTPLVFGHEFVGEIVEVGKEATDYFKIGERVSGEGHISCGHCRNCRGSKRHLCRKDVAIGSTRAGAFAEYLSLPAVNAFRLSDEISDSEAAIMDPFGNATHTALSFNLVGEDVLITGAGPVGLMAAAICRHVGARHVVITDVNPYRLQLAEKLGATLSVDASKRSLDDVMLELGMKEGFDVGLEMSGNPRAFNDMITHMNHGGKIALLGFLPHETQINWNMFILKGLQLKGIYGREMYETWYKMASMLQSGLDIKPVITHEFKIDDYQKAFEVMASGDSGKIILNWN